MKEITDYSKKSSWYKIPEITKDVDTFYVYATEYILSSLSEDAPDFATLDNAEMRQGVVIEYNAHATVFEDSTNVFVPYYRQSGLRYAGDIYKKAGNIDEANATTTSPPRSTSISRTTIRGGPSSSRATARARL